MTGGVMDRLIDGNISPHLLSSINDLAPRSLHEWTVGYDRVSDRAIRDYARNYQITVLSKDAVFTHRSLAFGHAPKVNWLPRVSGTEYVSGD